MAATSVPAPPSYSSSERLLTDDRSMEDISTEAQNASGNKKPQRLRSWLRVTAVVFPLLAVFFSMPALTISEVDEAGLSVLAFFLTMAVYGVTIIVAVSVLAYSSEAYH